MIPAHKQCVLFFTKWPQAGQVKTRLGADIGTTQGTQLYTYFVEDLAEQLHQTQSETICCYHPVDREDAFQAWLGPQFHYHAQPSAGLGERMEHAFGHAYDRGFDRVIVIGSDSPDLPASLLDLALESLRSHDAVIGPADDGGYYLIGFGRDHFRPSVFRNIEWSTESVFSQTMSHLHQIGVHTKVLAQRQDVDTGTDLLQLVRNSKDTPFALSKTFAYCRKQGWDRPIVDRRSRQQYDSPFGTGNE
jgi:rSAM/selenodomain-associated transferase 1